MKIYPVTKYTETTHRVTTPLNHLATNKHNQQISQLISNYIVHQYIQQRKQLTSQPNN
jgi:hypothetical protein